MWKNEKKHVVSFIRIKGVSKRFFYVLFFLTIFFIPCIMAQEQGQKKISLKANNEPLSTVLKRVSAMSGMKINFNTEDVEVYSVTVDINNKPVTDVLSAILNAKPFSFSCKDEFITIMKIVGKGVAVRSADYRVISGKVVDRQQQPLPGVNIRNKQTGTGTITDLNGNYFLHVSYGSTTLVYSYIGMASVELIVKPGNENQKLKTIELQEDNSSLDEVVVTGIFTKTRESYTGAATSFSRKQLEASGNRSLISSLRNLDPSFHIMDNIATGSNPNSLPTITIRGSSSLPTDVKDMQVSTENLRTANQPLFILDGFEISLSHFMDLDESQIENITLLKDANATALYGSKGSNGVIVITTKQIEAGKLRFTYKGTLSIEAPDLSSLNLMNSSEKLEYERLAGLYEYPQNALYDRDLKNLYNQRRMDVERGVDTYWPKYPVHTGIGSRHSVSIEGGDRSIRYGAGIGYNNTVGAMRGSERNVLNGNMFLQYRYKTVTFQDNLQIMNSRFKNSPYGSFAQYCMLNAYYTPFDESGNTQKVLENSNYINLNKEVKVYNPLYDALLPDKNTSSYTSIMNNFAIEWYILPELFVRGQFSLTKTFNRSDNYICADNTMFDGYTGSDYSRKGRYTYGTGEAISYDGRLTLNYSKEFANKHQIFLGLGMTIDESKSEFYSVTGEGISVNNMDFLGMASQYLKYARPSGSESISRDFGLLFNFRYTYDRRYFVDLNGKYDGSSQFGSNRHFAPFWSTGVGWNLHNEKFLLGSKILNIARFRASYGITGSQNFASYLSMRTYNDYGGKNTQGWYGVYLMAFGNPDLQWQKSKQWNIGTDLELLNRRLMINLDVYNKLTDNLLADVNMPLSGGFSSYKSNVGKVLNKGVELGVSAQIIRDVKNDLRWTVGVKAVHNSNKIKEISNSLQSLNDKLSSQSSYNPTFLYKEGESLNTLYVVRSKGIDPSSGKEIFIKQDGTETFTWDAKDKVACGVAEPKVEGTIHTNVNWKGVKVNLVFGYRLGGYAYNQTLANKVENIRPYDNADKRVLYDRWKQPGDIAKFKSVTDWSTTYATSRFIFKENTFYCSSINVGYEFPVQWVQKYLPVSYLSLDGYAEDLFWKSTIKRERGTDYPFSRKFSLSLTVRF